MDHDDLDLRPTPDTSDDAAALPPGAPLWPKILAAGLIVVVLITGYLVFRDRRTPPPASETAAESSEAAAPTVAVGGEAEAIALPPLDETDEIVRTLVAQLSAHPTLAAWLVTDNLIRAFTAVVSNIANDESPASHVPALRPRGRFLVEERGNRLYIDPRSYDRYAGLTAAATSIDPAGAARVYTILKPRIEEAYRDLGYQDESFDRALERAVARLLGTPLPNGPHEVQEVGADAYQFVDPTLETLQPAQKHLIRFGPDNARVVQASLRKIAAAIGMARDSLR
jgi:hypothetical protein